MPSLFPSIHDFSQLLFCLVLGGLSSLFVFVLPRFCGSSRTSHHRSEILHSTSAFAFLPFFSERTNMESSQQMMQEEKYYSSGKLAKYLQKNCSEMLQFQQQLLLFLQLQYSNRIHLKHGKNTDIKGYILPYRM